MKIILLILIGIYLVIFVIKVLQRKIIIKVFSKIDYEYMINLFRILKLDYKEYVILFKSGSFYVSFDEDSLILNKIFNYKIIELKNNIKSQFPLNSLETVINKLKN